MSNFELTLTRLRNVTNQLSGAQSTLVHALTQVEQAQTLITQATYTSNNPYVSVTLGALAATQETAAQAYTTLETARQILTAYTGSIGGTGSENSASTTRPPVRKSNPPPSSGTKIASDPRAREHTPNKGGGLYELVQVNTKDPSADVLAARIGGQSRVRFAGDPGKREFDAVSDRYVAQSKPANFTLNKSFRLQAKATFEVAVHTGRTPYFHFNGPPGPGVTEALERYARRYHVNPVIDTEPLGE